jgi:hypothetical protein
LRLLSDSRLFSNQFGEDHTQIGTIFLPAIYARIFR